MSTPAAESLLERSSTLWFVALLSALLFGVTNLPWTLDDYDQAKQAFTSFEMVQEGHWLYQHTPNEKIATKPPLIGWISAGCFAVTRSWETAWRLPSVAAAVALGVMLTRAATTAYGTGGGLLALSAFGLNLLSPRLATLVRTDMPLALVVFLLGLKIWSKLRSADRWTRRDRLVMFALLTAAMLIKGPIVYAFLLPGIFVFQWRNGRAEKKASAWCGWWPWLASLGIFLAWAGGGMALVPGFYEQVVLKEFAGRFGETMHRPQPFYFYLPHLLHKFAPWSLLAIALAIWSWRAQTKARLMERWQRLSPEVTWLICWSFGGLLVLSLIPSKRVDRIFPIVPPLCLLLAAQFAQLRESARVRRWSAVALIAAAFFASAYSVAKIVVGYRSHDGALVHFGTAVREQGAANEWRYGVIRGQEEGLLLYLRRAHFLKTEEAIALWNSGALDALVAPAPEVPRLLEQMPGAALSSLEVAETIDGRAYHYVLLKRG